VDWFTARNMDNIKEQNMSEVRKIKRVFFTHCNVVACLYAVHSTLFSVVCFRIHSVGAKVFRTKRIGKA
jgi:lipopolysaccharide/colanic/teichoic acid biosynthesis glycosyltransferase